MAIRRILTVNNPADLVVLKSVCAPVAEVTDETRALMDDMLETMYDAPGIGLAAIQIGVMQRVVVMDLGEREASEGDGSEREGPGSDAAPAEPVREPRYFVNPEITWASEETAPYEEGCLSIPEYFDTVERPARVRLRYLDYHGNAVEEEADGLYAVCIQHEIDHLNGKLFIDHLSRLRRDRAMAKVKKTMRERKAA
ncbi:MAG: peptide deformylase [Brevundimonas sp.]|jgi:peptide deformylase|uniref:peptide deformylase n=1 Tax=Brevundimonas sp. TaxID=1871086 RepID=UPI003919231B